ncbi:hypothetical protein [Microbacterium panaciterrae]|uniref:Sulfur reduction protein DsrE n=1 Tax=Microbacterium panaciterrae TaxID=985759 RepID=A0ABP8PPW3_9MICO
MPTTNTVVLHVSDRPEDVARAIDSAHTLHANRPAYRIRIIVNGPALRGATVDGAPLDLSRLPEGAGIEACEVGMRSRGIPTDTLQAGVRTTASAVVALSEAQLAGAAYVRI